ncbi:hypothetical protein AFCA_012967 [Aspergillus flavus]|uniref:Uncharacterized protein n=1 Tax=Aspergillus flavus TaxID=5059 RepID=A0AB74CFD8_ASPFL|nr:hypothetical protein COH20_003192 [Aspergillus flavus]RAQ66610.1 hypothetical protein COH21_010550 [Aspergillus flavus]RMZ44042.1 hypothetical protein CA14_004208 [Aspergillus flavus]UDD65794.1 hypothetical protein AFCA_012967 [Aspergillus flavus]
MGFEYERVDSSASDPELSLSNDAIEEETLLQTANKEQSKASHNIFVRGTKRLLSSPRTRIARDTFICLLALWGLISIAHNIFLAARRNAPRKHCYCGNSTSEAISLGCKFDSLAAAWLPPYCRDDELTAEFERSGPGPNGSWDYFADDYHKIPMTLEEVAALGDNQSAKVMMTREWHVVHCLFYWRKQFRVRFREAQGGIVEPSFDSETHINHCISVILEDSWGTEARIALDS